MFRYRSRNNQGPMIRVCARGISCNRGYFRETQMEVPLLVEEVEPLLLLGVLA